MNKGNIGSWGEEIACNYIIKKGMTVISRNYRSKFGEIDIIARDDNCIVFIEVKTRKNNLYGNASEYVTRKKQEKIILTAQEYIGSDIDTEMRFDVIEVYYYEYLTKPNVKRINHIKNAFISEK